MIETFRKRFPTPWRIVEVIQAFEIFDKDGNRTPVITTMRQWHSLEPSARLDVGESDLPVREYRV